jgi:hypothetical protein
MNGEVSLARLLATMSPQQRAGRFVFATVDQWPGDIEVLASVRETEGLSLVVTQEDAERLQLRYDFVAGWITLRVHSALAAVGLTAAVSTALADAGISCNVVAGYHHDHVLVPLERVDETLTILRGLADNGSVVPWVCDRPR